MIKKWTFLCVIGISIAFSVVADEPSCQQGFQSDLYRFANDGTVTDLKTGLTWQRCLLGQTYSNAGTPEDYQDDQCHGQPLELDWYHALQQVDVLQNARLPAPEELFSLLERTCGNQVVNRSLFPGTLEKGMLLSSEIMHPAKDELPVYYVGVNLAGVQYMVRSKTSAYLRLIR